MCVIPLIMSSLWDKSAEFSTSFVEAGCNNGRFDCRKLPWNITIELKKIQKTQRTEPVHFARSFRPQDTEKRDLSTQSNKREIHVVNHKVGFDQKSKFELENAHIDKNLKKKPTKKKTNI